MSPLPKGDALMNGPMHHDMFNGARVHTMARKGRPCWLLFEIGLALGVDDLDITPLAPIENEDYDLLSPTEGDRARLQLGFPANGEALVQVYEPGLTMACTMIHDGGSALRRTLLLGSAREVKRTLRKARLEHRVRETIKQIELEDRTRKAALLHRLVEHCRQSGPLRGDDDAYVEAMAIVAETATGLVFPTNAPSQDRIASELGEQPDSVRGALVALCEEINA
jgi:hypothetical protein